MVLNLEEHLDMLLLWFISNVFKFHCTIDMFINIRHVGRCSDIKREENWDMKKAHLHLAREANDARELAYISYFWQKETTHLHKLVIEKHDKS